MTARELQTARRTLRRLQRVSAQLSERSKALQRALRLLAQAARS